MHSKLSKASPTFSLTVMSDFFFNKFLITKLFTTCLFLLNQKYLSLPRIHKDIFFAIKEGRKASLT